MKKGKLLDLVFIAVMLVALALLGAGWMLALLGTG